MGVIITFFKTVWEGLIGLISWLIGIPALIVSSIVGLYTSINAIYDSLVLPNTVVEAVNSKISPALQTATNAYSTAPDIVHLAVYCLSLDVAWSFFVDLFSFFLGVVFVIVVFFLVTIPGYFFDLVFD